MDKTVIIVCVFLFVIQTSLAQVNLAALLGLGGFGDMTGSQSSGSSSCPYQAHADRRKFQQMVNNRLMTQECAPGTMFVLSKCSCDNVPKGGNAGGPLPGSNPRMEANMGGGNNNLLNALMNQLGGVFPSPTPQRPPPRNNSPMNTNQLNAIRQKVTSGVRPDQSNRGNIATNRQKPPPSRSSNIKYNLGPDTGLTSIIDPSLLPDVLPPEILQVLQNTNNAPAYPAKKRPTSAKRPPNSNSGLPQSVQKMLDRASKPPSRRPPTGRPRIDNTPTGRPTTRKQSPPTKSPPITIPGKAIPTNGLPTDVVKMLQKSVQPPRNVGKRKPARTYKQRATKTTPAAKKPGIKPTAPPRRYQPPTKMSRSRSDPLAHMMAQMTAQRGMNRRRKPTSARGPQKDPLAALLGGISQPSRAPTRSTNRATNRATNTGTNRSTNRGTNNNNSLRRGSSRSTTRGTSKNNASPPGGNPMAALFAGMGGNSGSSSTGRGNDPLAALLAGMGGGSGSTGGASGGNNANLASLMAGLGGNINAGGPGAPGGSSNAAALLATGAATGTVIDMTNYFNAQGIARGVAGLSDLKNIDYLKLRALDHHEVIDIGDLTNAGLAAANAYFAKMGR